MIHSRSSDEAVSAVKKTVDPVLNKDQGLPGNPLAVGTALAFGLALTSISILAPTYTDPSLVQGSLDDRIGPALAIGAIAGTFGTLLRAVAHNRPGSWRNVDYAGKLLAVVALGSVMVGAFVKLTNAERNSLQTGSLVALGIVVVAMFVTRFFVNRAARQNAPVETPGAVS